MKIVIDTNWFDRPLRQRIDTELGPEGWGTVVDLWLWCAVNSPDGSLNNVQWMTDELLSGLRDSGMLTGDPDAGTERMRMPPVVEADLSPKATNPALATKQSSAKQDPISRASLRHVAIANSQSYSTAGSTGSEGTASVSERPDCQVVGPSRPSTGPVLDSSVAPIKQTKEKKERMENLREPSGPPTIDDLPESVRGTLSQSQPTWCENGRRVEDNDSACQATSSSEEKQGITSEGTTETANRSIAVPKPPCQAKSTGVKETSVNNINDLQKNRHELVTEINEKDLDNELNTIKDMINCNDDAKKISVDTISNACANTFGAKPGLKWTPLLKHICPVTIGEIKIAAERIRENRHKIQGPISTGYFVRCLEGVRHDMEHPARPRSSNKPSGTRSHIPEYTNDVMALISKLEPLALGADRVGCFLAQTLIGIAKSHGHNLFAFDRCRSAITHVLPQYTLPSKLSTEMLDPWPAAMRQQSQDEYWAGHADLKEWIDGIKP